MTTAHWEVTSSEARNEMRMLLDAVNRGSRIVICRHGKQVAALVPLRDLAVAELSEAEEAKRKAEEAYDHALQADYGIKKAGRRKSAAVFAWQQAKKKVEELAAEGEES